MKRLINFTINILSRPAIVFAGLCTLSLFSLGAALTTQYGFGLEPCILCMIQRAPHLVIALLSITGLILTSHSNNNNAPAALMALCALTYLTGTGIAFYHVGVEQHWWISVLESCKSDFSGDASAILAQIKAKPAVPCDQIPWQMFGISMAGYNALSSAGLTFMSALSARLIYSNAKRA